MHALRAKLGLARLVLLDRGELRGELRARRLVGELDNEPDPTQEPIPESNGPTEPDVPTATEPMGTVPTAMAAAAMAGSRPKSKMAALVGFASARR